MKILFLTLLIVISGSMFAQSNEDAVLKNIPERSAKKIAKAEKLLEKGNRILQEAKKYDDEIEANKAKYSKHKVRKLTGKSVKIKMKAAPYLEDGYKKKTKTLLKVLKDMRKVNPQLASRLKEAEVNSGKKIKEAKKLYRKGDDLSSKDKSVEYFDSGNKALAEAIDLMIEGLGLVYNVGGDKNAASAETVKDSIITKNDTEEPTITVEKEASAEASTVTAVESPNTVAAATAASTGVVAAGAVANENSKKVADDQQDIVPAENAKVAEGENAGLTGVTAGSEAAVKDTVTAEKTDGKDPLNVFFTIQFIADKKPVSEEVLKSKYSGDQEIVKMESDGWYRYSAGKFIDLQKAKVVMKSEDIRGFIVAYKNGKRITISEAIALLK